MRLSFFLIFIAFISFFYALPTCSPSNSIQNEFYSFLPAMALLGAAVLGAAYALGTALGNRQLLAWTKVELESYITSAILAVIVFGLFTADWFTGRFGISDAQPDNIISFFEERVETLRDKAFSEVLDASFWITLQSGYFYSISYPGIFSWGEVSPSFSNIWTRTTGLGGLLTSYSKSKSPYVGLSPISVAISQLSYAIINTIGIYSLLSLLVSFFNCVAIFMLPVSLGLRFIPWTKKIGSTALAVSLGIYFFFPLSFAIIRHIESGSAALDDAYGNLLDNSFEFHKFSSMCIPVPPGTNTLCTGPIKTITTVPVMVWTLSICVPWAIVKSIGGSCAFVECFWDCYNSVSTLYGLAQLGIFLPTSVGLMANDNPGISVEYWEDAVQEFQNLLFPYTLFAYIYLIFSILFTMAGIKGLSEFIGGEVFILGLRRFL